MTRMPDWLGWSRPSCGHANGKASKRNGKPAMTVARATPESKPSAPRRQREAA